jgi:hypothetical protein
MLRKIIFGCLILLMLIPLVSAAVNDLVVDLEIPDGVQPGQEFLLDVSLASENHNQIGTTTIKLVTSNPAAASFKVPGEGVDGATISGLDFGATTASTGSIFKNLAEWVVIPANEGWILGKIKMVAGPDGGAFSITIDPNSKALYDFTVPPPVEFTYDIVGGPWNFNIVAGQQCQDFDGDGFADIACGGLDCNDGDADYNPGVAEICGNDVDENCDGQAPACIDQDLGGPAFGDDDPVACAGCLTNSGACLINGINNGVNSVGDLLCDSSVPQIFSCLGNDLDSAVVQQVRGVDYVCAVGTESWIPCAQAQGDAAAACNPDGNNAVVTKQTLLNAISAAIDANAGGSILQKLAAIAEAIRNNIAALN